MQAVMLLLALILGGCTSTGKTVSQAYDQDVYSSNAQVEEILTADELIDAELELAENELKENDPFEGMNRKIYKFNMTVDKYLVKPVAKAYSKYTPMPVKRGVKHFFSNLWEPTTIINDLLQAKFGQAVQDSTRFALNTTVGVLGIFDVATRLNLYKNSEDFGQSMAVWGIPSGPYIVLPLLGPSNVRDAAGLITQYLYTDMLSGLDSTTGEYIGGTLRAVDTRTSLLGLDDILELQVDPYVFMRETHRQKRQREILDGKEVPSAEDEQEEKTLEDEILELEDELL